MASKRKTFSRSRSISARKRASSPLECLAVPPTSKTEQDSSGCKGTEWQRENVTRHTPLPSHSHSSHSRSGTPTKQAILKPRAGCQKVRGLEQSGAGYEQSNFEKLVALSCTSPQQSDVEKCAGNSCTSPPTRKARDRQQALPKPGKQHSEEIEGSELPHGQASCHEKSEQKGPGSPDHKFDAVPILELINFPCIAEGFADDRCEDLRGMLNPFLSMLPDFNASLGRQPIEDIWEHESGKVCIRLQNKALTTSAARTVEGLVFFGTKLHVCLAKIVSNCDQAQNKT